MHVTDTREERKMGMTYDEYIAQQRKAMEEQSDDVCFLENQPEGQFVRGH